MLTFLCIKHFTIFFLLQYKYVFLDPVAKSIISLSVQIARTQRKKFSISRIGVSFWNALDTQIKLSCCCCCCRPHSTNVLPAESSTRNHVAASSLSPQVARKGSTLSGFVQRSRLEREVCRDLHSNKWEEV